MAAVGKSGQYWSAFSPSNIPGLALWYDFSDTSTLDLSGDYLITRIRDKSGKGYHGTPTGASNPFYLIYDSVYKGAYRGPQRTAVNIQTDISLDSTWRFYSFAAAVTGETEDVIRSTNRDQGWFFRYTSGKWAGGANANAQLIFGDGAYPDAPSVGSWISGGIMRGWKNGTQYNYDTCTPPRAQSNVGAVRIGTQTLFNAGLYNEILIYSNGITDADRAALDEYLIRKWMINPNYTSAITAPTDISGCVLWLDSSGDTANNFVFGPSSSNVYKWIDKSGNNYDVSTIGTNYPIWTSADTSGMYLTSTTTMSTTAPVPPTGEETGFFVGIRVGQAANRTLVGSATTRTGVIRNIIVGGGTAYGVNQSNGAGIQSTLLGGSTTSNSLVTWRTQGIREVVVKVNGNIGLYSTTWSNTTTATGTTTIGPAFHCCKEMVTYNRALSPSELSNVERYLIKKWGVSNAMDYPIPTINRPFSQTPAFSRRVEFPNDIAPCMLWLDAADSNTLILDSNNNVLRWLDKSGLQNDVCASVPAVSPAVTGPVYSNQTVTFSNNRMTVRNTLTSSSNFRMFPGLTVANHTLMAVHKPLVVDASSTGNTGLFDFSIQSTSTSNVSFPTMVGTTPRGWTWSGGASVTRTTSPMVENSTTSNYNIITASIAYLRQTVYNNGVVQSDLSGQTITGFVFNASNSIMSIGRWGSNTSNFYQGDVKEMFVFDRALGEYEIAYMESYLAKKWNLTSLLPSNHFAFSSTAIPPLVTTKFSPNAYVDTPIWLDAYSFSSNHSNEQTITTNWPNLGIRDISISPTGTPTYLSNAYNGRPGVRMTGGTFVCASGISITSNAHQTFIVASYDSDSSGNRYALSYRTSSTTSPSHRALVVGTDGSLNSDVLGSTNARVGIAYGYTRPTPGVPFIVEVSGNENNVGISVNGSILSNAIGGFATGNTTYNTLYIGRDVSTNAQASWRGNIHEIIVFPRPTVPVNEQLRQMTRSYLANKWGVSNASWTTYAPYKGIGP